MTLEQFLYRCISESLLEKKENVGLLDITEQLQKLFLQNTENQKIPIFILKDTSSSTSKIILNREVISCFSKTLGLLYLSENEITGNVCFANSDEIQHDFKTTLTKSDLLEYTLGCLKTEMKVTKRLDATRLKLPKKPEEFWKMVQFSRE